MREVRVVLHVDLDAFFVQVERHRDPLLHGVPMVVQQHQDIIAVSYEARALGIKKHMAPATVRSKFPQVKLVHAPTFRGKVTYKAYRKASSAIFTLLKGFCQKYEKASIDEAYFEPEPEKEIFLPVGAAMQGSCVSFETGPESGSSESMDNNSCKLLDLPSIKALPQQKATGTSGRNPFSDCWLEAGRQLGEKMQIALSDILSYDCSVGIAENKLLAKIASDVSKPKGIKVVKRSQVQELLRALPLSKLRGCKEGSKGFKVLSKRGIQTIGQVQELSSRDLSLLFGPTLGSRLHEACRGVDVSEIKVSQPKQKISTQMALTPVPIPAFAIGRPNEMILPMHAWEASRVRAHVETLALDLVERVGEEAEETANDSNKNGRRPSSVTVTAILRSGSRRTNTSPFPSILDEDDLVKKIIFEAMKPFEEEDARHKRSLKVAPCDKDPLIKLILTANFSKDNSSKAAGGEQYSKHGVGQDSIAQFFSSKPKSQGYHEPSCTPMPTNGLPGCIPQTEYADEIEEPLKDGVAPNPESSALSQKKPAPDSPASSKVDGEWLQPVTVHGILEVCRKCRACLPPDKMQSHKDYHTALELQAQIDSMQEGRQKSSTRKIQSFPSQSPKKRQKTTGKVNSRRNSQLSLQKQHNTANLQSKEYNKDKETSANEATTAQLVLGQKASNDLQQTAGFKSKAHVSRQGSVYLSEVLLRLKSSDDILKFLQGHKQNLL